MSPREQIVERILLVLVCVLALAAAAFEAGSPIAQKLSRQDPIRLFLGYQYADPLEEPPALFFVQYDPGRRWADLLFFPSGTRAAPLRGADVLDDAALTPPRAARSSLRAVYQRSYARGGDGYAAFLQLVDAARSALFPDAETHETQGPTLGPTLFIPAAGFDLETSPALARRVFGGGSGGLRGLLQRLSGGAQRRKRSVAPVRPRSGAEWGAVRSELGFYDLTLLAREAFAMAPEDIRVAWLPGTPGPQGWLPDSPQVRSLLDRLGRPPPEAPSRTILAEVLNASGRKGVAMDATNILRWAGVDVVKLGNAAEPSPSTQVIDRTGDIRPAQRVLQALGAPEAEFFTQLDSRRLVDVTVILGEDYR